MNAFEKERVKKLTSKAHSSKLPDHRSPKVMLLYWAIGDRNVFLWVCGRRTEVQLGKVCRIIQEWITLYLPQTFLILYPPIKLFTMITNSQ